MARVKETQNAYILHFMEMNSSVLFGKFASSSGNHKKKKLWKELTDELNKLGPPTKSDVNWKKVMKQSMLNTLRIILHDLVKYNFRVYHTIAKYTFRIDNILLLSSIGTN